MNGIGWAIKEMQNGEKVARTGWNGVQSQTGFVPPSRKPVVYEGLCYILLATGDIAFCDAEDYELVAEQENWTLMGNGYPAYTNNLERKTVNLHKLLVPSEGEVDHENGNKLDSRRRNLRTCTSSENNSNRPSLLGSSSRFKGVTWDKSRDKWMAAIADHGKSRTLGRFNSEEAAAHAYDLAATESYGDFARLNFPRPKCMFLYYVPDGQYPAKTSVAKATWGEECLVPYQAYIAMKTVQGTVVPWLASQTDLLAMDYEVVE